MLTSTRGNYMLLAPDPEHHNNLVAIRWVPYSGAFVVWRGQRCSGVQKRHNRLKVRTNRHDLDIVSCFTLGDAPNGCIAPPLDGESGRGNW